MRLRSLVWIGTTVWILLFHLGLASAQDPRDIRFEVLDTEDGFSNNWMESMARDSSGYLWVSTRGGLNRYDGHTVKVFRHSDQDTASLLNDYGHNLRVDPKGRLWVSAYVDGGFSMFDETCQCFRHYYPSPEKDRLPQKRTAIIYFDGDSTVWLNAGGMGLAIFNLATQRIRQYNLPFIDKKYALTDQVAYNSVYGVYKSGDGLFWLSTHNGLYRFDSKAGHFEYKQMGTVGPGTLRDDCFGRLMPDGEKGLWLTSFGGGLSYYRFATQQFQNYKFSKSDLNNAYYNIVSDVAPKSESELWVATADKGLLVFDQVNKTWQECNIALTGGEADKNNLHSILKTPDGFMFALSTNGILKYSPKASTFHFRSLSIAQSQNSGQFTIIKILEDPARNAVYFATHLGNGLNVLDTRSGKLEAYAVKPHPDRKHKLMLLSDMLMDKAGNLWVLSEDFLHKFDPQQKRLKQVSATIGRQEYTERPTFRNIFEDTEGRLWVLTNQGGLHQWRPDENTFSKKINMSSISGAPITIKYAVCDPKGRIWLIGDGNICAYEPKTGRFTERVKPEIQQLATNAVRSVAVDPSGNVWIAINQTGLLRLSTQNLENVEGLLLSDTNGLLPTKRIFNMNVDPQGNVWMATVLGVIYMNATDFSYRTFTQSAGMDKNVAYMAILGGNNGAFYIASPGKYCRADFEAVNRKMAPPKVYIDKFSVLNQERLGQVWPNTVITLKPHENVFSFEYGCIDFSNQALYQFVYMLEGWDKDWVQAGARRYASYTNLAGDRYVFKVKVANSEGVWSEPVSVTVMIETPLQKQAWFIALIALFFAGLVYALYRYRVREVEETERLKTEFNRQLTETRMEALRAQMNPHFIFNSLNSINRYIIKSDIKTASLYLTRFAKLIRLILDNSKNRKVVLANELEALQLYVDMESLRFDHQFTYDITCDDDVDADNIEIPPLIIQPYVENAIWHGLLPKEAAGHLSVHVSQKEALLTCAITDNGIGRARAAAFKSKNAPTRQSVGMKLTEERLHIATDKFSVSGTQEVID
ncbi:MAG: histidine kinase, partial [Saprospiraceae bacterium]